MSGSGPGRVCSALGLAALTLRNRAAQASGAEGDRTPDLRLAKPPLSQLSYSPAVPARAAWTVSPRCRWAWAELNCRPHAYQACALTT